MTVIGRESTFQERLPMQFETPYKENVSTQQTVRIVNHCGFQVLNRNEECSIHLWDPSVSALSAPQHYINPISSYVIW